MRGYPVGMKELLLIIKKYPTNLCGGNHEPKVSYYKLEPFPFPVQEAIQRKLIVVLPCPHDNDVHHSTITPLGMIALMILNSNFEADSLIT